MPNLGTVVLRNLYFCTIWGVHDWCTISAPILCRPANSAQNSARAESQNPAWTRRLSWYGTDMFAVLYVCWWPVSVQWRAMQWCFIFRFFTVMYIYTLLFTETAHVASNIKTVWNVWLCFYDTRELFVQNLCSYQVKCCKISAAISNTLLYFSCNFHSTHNIMTSTAMKTSLMRICW